MLETNIYVYAMSRYHNNPELTGRWMIKDGEEVYLEVAVEAYEVDNYGRPLISKVITRKYWFFKTMEEKLLPKKRVICWVPSTDIRVETLEINTCQSK